jgi:hypothetical protein
MMPVLKNAKHELFSQALAKGCQLSIPMRRQDISPIAALPVGSVSVRARLNELLEEAAELK